MLASSGWAAQRFHRHVDLGVQIPEVFRVDLVLQLAHLVGGLIRVVHRQGRCSGPGRLSCFGHTQHHVFTDGSGFRVQLWLLREVANFGPLSVPRLAGESPCPCRP